MCFLLHHRYFKIIENSAIGYVCFGCFNQDNHGSMNELARGSAAGVKILSLGGSAGEGRLGWEQKTVILAKITRLRFSKSRKIIVFLSLI